MPIISIVMGALLVGLGVWGYTTSDLEGSVKITALIPAFVGGPLILCGLLALKESLLKHAMHAAAMFGLIGVLLAGGRIGQVAATKGLDWSKSSVQATAAMTALCVIFVALCVNSFIQARRRRAAAQNQAIV